MWPRVRRSAKLTAFIGVAVAIGTAILTVALIIGVLAALAIFSYVSI